MRKSQPLYTFFCVAAASVFSAQVSNTSMKLYPALYDNQQSHVAVTGAAEKVALSAKDQLEININSMSNDPVLRNATWGFALYDPKTKKVISSYNQDLPLIPASLTKILTTESALNYLGPEFRWNTQLEYAGEIDENGTLNGNLYLIGSGDPSLGTGKAGAYRYAEIASEYRYQLDKLGIKKINGNIVTQTAVFKNNKISSLPANVVWMEHGTYYLPVGSTANINPANEKLIAKKSNPFQESKNYYYVSPYIKQLVYADKYEPVSLTTKLADAPVSLANILRADLLKNGLPITGKVEVRMVEQQPEPRKIVYTYKSPTLGEIIFDTNQRSDNALAEAIVRTVGFQRLGDQTLESGRVAVTEHLQASGFDTVGLNYFDGSGLSRSNTVTPIAHVKYLSALQNEKYFKTFFDSLPVAGQSGTLKKSFLGTGYGQIYAKTGTLSRVKALAGYVKTYSGRLLPFSVIVNNYSGSVDQVKQRMEKILAPALEL